MPLVRSSARQAAKHGAGFGGSGIGGAKTGAAAKLSGGDTSGRGSVNPGGADHAARPAAGIGCVRVKLGKLGTRPPDCQSFTPFVGARETRG